MTRSMILPLAILLASPCAALRAAAPCCNGCGCQPCTRKVCRLVCEEKEITTREYTCKCEDFCLPGRSIRCKPCDCHWWCCCLCDHATYKPTCGCVRTKHVLVLHDVKTKKPSYKCVVEEICTRCGHCASKVDYPSADDPTTAMEMVKGQGADPANATQFEQQPNQTDDASAPATEVASRNFVERLFVRQ